MVEIAHKGTTVTEKGCNSPECWCGSSTQVIVAFPKPTPESVGAEIRRLLLTLRVEGHTAEQEQQGRYNYGSDQLRSRALDIANICWFGSGKMHSDERRCNGRPFSLDDFTWQPPEDWKNPWERK